MKTQQKGFIHIIVIAILLIIIVSLLGVSLRSVFSNTVLQENFRAVGDWLSWLWNSPILAPLRYFFNLFLIPVWDRFLDALRHINLNQPK